MNFYILTTKQSEVCLSLQRYLLFVHHIRLFPITIQNTNNATDFIRVLRETCHELECRDINLYHTAIFVDPTLATQAESAAVPIDTINPLSKETNWLSLIGLLILGYPEVHWCFLPGSITPPSDGKTNASEIHLSTIDNINEFIEKIKLCVGEPLIALFDPTALRTTIRANMNKKDHTIPERHESAASIDEEFSYAIMNAYTAYRFGYCTWTISSEALLKYLFAEFHAAINPLAANFSLDLKLTFEDLFLNFTDRSSDAHLSILEERYRLYSKLISNYSSQHIFITVGHSKTSVSRKKWSDNRTYLVSQNIKYKFLFKPLSGLYDLWKKAGKWSTINNYPLLGKDFVWPPAEKSLDIDKADSHSAPGRILLVAEKLLQRAQQILNNARTAADAIHAAALALEAKELLACKTPTIALRALSLQHEAEVEAECRFYGVEYDFDVSTRIWDIKREVKAISTWFNPKASKRSQLNAEIKILTQLAHRYQKYGEFDEENLCLYEVRKLGTRLWARRGKIRWILFPVKLYINFLLKSLGRFFVVILGWIGVFTLLYWKILQDTFGHGKILHSLFMSTQTFIAFQPPDRSYYSFLNHDPSDILMLLFILSSLLGFIHLGVFVSHLYLILTRKSGG